MKKLLSTVLAGAMCLSMSTAFAAEMNFTDVTESDWFYNDVKTAVELGLVSGKAEAEYAPADNLTYAEAIKLAACMNQLYSEKAVTLVPGEPWYQSFVDYCKEKNIITKDYDFSEYATRSGYMEIFANALPAEALAEINNVPYGSIPDVTDNNDFAESVYKLYRAGILAGVDDEHNCNPEKNITRAEVAAILTRMMDETKRVSFDMGVAEPVEDSKVEEPKDDVKQEEEKKDEPEATGFRVTKQPESVNAKVGVISEFSVEVAGNKGLCDYQWQYEVNGKWQDFGNTGTTIMNATTETLKLYAQEVMEMNIRCKITNNGDSIYSEVVTISVTAE